MAETQCFEYPKGQAEDLLNFSHRWVCRGFYRLHGIGLSFVHAVVRSPGRYQPLGSSLMQPANNGKVYVYATLLEWSLSGNYMYIIQAERAI